jgi:hypothetical protein
VKSFNRDNEKRRRNWWGTRKAKVARALREVPQTFTADLLTLTVCCRYAESLLKNPRVKKYVMKHYPEEVRDLETLLAGFERG